MNTQEPPRLGVGAVNALIASLVFNAGQGDPREPGWGTPALMLLGHVANPQTLPHPSTRLHKAPGERPPGCISLSTLIR